MKHAFQSRTSYAVIARIFANVAVMLQLFAFGVAGAENDDRFDLVCDLQEKTSFHPGQVTRFSRHLSIDLGAKEWCSRDEGCATRRNVVLVTGDEIRLSDIDSSFMRLETSIDRTTWTWRNRVHIKEVIDSNGETFGPCKKEPFTTFPANMKPGL
jgi:hypothetical protein